MLGTNRLTLQPQKNPAITSMTPATILCRKTPAAAVSKTQDYGCFVPKIASNCSTTNDCLGAKPTYLI
jgi:hypothetical protein